MKTRIWAYKDEESINIISDELKIPILLKNGKYKPEKGDTIINWGSSKIPEKLMIDGLNWINHPSAIAISSNKLTTFEVLKDVCRIPEWTTDPEIVKTWLKEDNKVYCRTLLKSSKGNGIIIIAPGSTVIPEAKLYTKAVQHKVYEIRAFVFGDELLIRKKVAPEMADNCGDEYIFKPLGHSPLGPLKVQCNYAVKALGLDFGAVDAIVTTQDTVVLEVNSAPQLQPWAFKNFLLENLKKKIGV